MPRVVRIAVMAAEKDERNNEFLGVEKFLAHQAQKLELIERLRDPAVRARLKKELATPANMTGGTTNGSRCLVRRRFSSPPRADTDPGLGLQGRSLADIAKERGTDPDGTHCSTFSSRTGAHLRRGFRHERYPDVALAAVQPWVSFCNDSEGTAPDGVLGSEFPHPRARMAPSRASSANGPPRSAACPSRR